METSATCVVMRKEVSTSQKPLGGKKKKNPLRNKTLAALCRTLGEKKGPSPPVIKEEKEGGTPSFARFFYEEWKSVTIYTSP